MQHGNKSDLEPTRTRLNLVAHGGPNGAALSVAATNLGKLSHISGPGLPLASIARPAKYRAMKRALQLPTLKMAS